MNPTVVLALISDLYNQNAVQAEEIQRLRTALTEAQQATTVHPDSVPV